MKKTCIALLFFPFCFSGPYRVTRVLEDMGMVVTQYGLGPFQLQVCVPTRHVEDEADFADEARVQ